jgi:hypothetical protein
LLNLFDDASAPNTRELARRFVTLDNFYADAEVSADGWSWSTRTGPIMLMPTAPRRSSLVPTRRPAASTRPSTPPRRCCAPSS